MRCIVVTFLFCAFLSSPTLAQGYGDPNPPENYDNPFDTPNDDWGKTFNDSTSNDDRFKTEKPRMNNDLDNRWRSPRQKRQSIGDIHSKQFQQRSD